MHWSANAIKEAIEASQKLFKIIFTNWHGNMDWSKTPKTMLNNGA
jgi:hypothetical protein